MEEMITITLPKPVGVDRYTVYRGPALEFLGTLTKDGWVPAEKKKAPVADFLDAARYISEGFGLPTGAGKSAMTAMLLYGAPKLLGDASMTFEARAELTKRIMKTKLEPNPCVESNPCAEIQLCERYYEKPYLQSDGRSMRQPREWVEGRDFIIDTEMKFDVQKMRKHFDESVAACKVQYRTPIIGNHDDGCNHLWKEYIGFTNRFEYCTKCDQKRGLST